MCWPVGLGELNRSGFAAPQNTRRSVCGASRSYWTIDKQRAGPSYGLRFRIGANRETKSSDLESAVDRLCGVSSIGWVDCRRSTQLTVHPAHRGFGLESAATLAF